MDILERIKESIREGDSVLALVEEALAAMAPAEVLNGAVIPGIRKAGDLWQDGTYFLPDVILATESFKKEAMDLLKPRLGAGDTPRAGKFLIGVVRRHTSGTCARGRGCAQDLREVSHPRGYR